MNNVLNINLTTSIPILLFVHDAYLWLQGMPVFRIHHCGSDRKETSVCIQIQIYVPLPIEYLHRNFLYIP